MSVSNQESDFDLSLPFFAYGIFKKGELAYHKIQGYVEKDEMTNERGPALVEGDLIVEDGMALMLTGSQVSENSRDIEGSLINFREEDAEDAYNAIEDAEPMTHYSWEIVRTNAGTEANALVFDPKRTIRNLEEKRFQKHKKQVHWESKAYFEDVFDVVSIQFESNKHLRDEKEFFKLQMGYFLLWSALERYISLSWGKAIPPSRDEKKERFAKEDEGFEQGLQEIFAGQTPEAYRELSRSDYPESTIELDLEQNKDVIKYFYQVRNNLTHRGKGKPTADGELLRQSYHDLYSIFAIVLENQYGDSMELPSIQI